MPPWTDPVAVLTLLIACVAGAEWLGQRGAGRRLGPAILVLVLGGLLGNSGLVPSASTAPPIYDGIFRYVAPMSIFLLLLDVRLAALRQVGWPMAVAFLLGATGTVCGVLLALQLTDIHEVLGERAGALAGMYTGTYIGGSSNFNAIALHYDVVEDGAVFAGATAVDATLGTVWIIMILAMPAIMRALGVTRRGGTNAPTSSAAPPAQAPLDVTALAVLLLLTLAAMHVSDKLASAGEAIGVPIPPILLLTTFALIAAQVPWVHGLGGARVLGQFSAYLFLAVVGVHCEVESVLQLGDLAPTLLLFVTITLCTHSAVLIGAGLVWRIDPAVLTMGSNANIMGATTAPAVAESIGRHDLVLPGILAGSLGSALGTYLGFLVAQIA